MRSSSLLQIALATIVAVTGQAAAETRSESHDADSNVVANSTLCSEAPTNLLHDKVHDGDSRKAGEHAAALNLVRQREATDKAMRSGPWSDPRTWENRRVPGPNAKVLIPKELSVEVDTTLDKQELDWIRVDGRLAFRPDRNTALTVRTLVVTTEGVLQIGSEAMPVRADVRAQILFALRGQRNLRDDPFDLSGGLISHGTVRMIAAGKTAHAATSTPLKRGTHRLDFDQPPSGWRIGDRLLVPGTDAYTNQDEVRTIAGVGNAGRTVSLDGPLSLDHFAPSGVLIPVANLTRNIELRSRVVEPMKARGHVMIMHAQTGTVIDGVAFVHLGRTDTRRVHTLPEIGAGGLTKTGTDANTIGRYALHFHVLSGARRDVAPHVVRNSVVIDSPKYGIVNHGGHLVAEDNVTFQIAGSHFVAENGSEIGAFRRNLAVRSAGSGEAAIENRMSLYDFGHGGHGFWLQSNGVELADNWAFGHARAGIFSMGMTFREHGKEVFFDAKNTDNPLRADELGRVRSANVDFYFARNTVAGSGLGLEIWYHKLSSDRRVLSVADGLTVWNVSESAVSVLYARSVALRNLRLVGSRRPGIAGIMSNELTESISIEDADIRDFAVGIRLAERGQNLVRNTTLANEVNLQIPITMVKGREIHLDHLKFDSSEHPDGVDLALLDINVRYADLALLYQHDRIDLTDQHGRNYRLFFPIQAPAAIPFPQDGPEVLRGLTSAEIHRRYGLAPGGAFAPEDAIKLPRSNALASPSPRTSEAYGVIAGTDLETYPMQTQHFMPTTGSGASGWHVFPLKQTGGTTIAYAGNNPVKFMLRRGLLPLEIHPDDVPYGYRVAGHLLERVDRQVTMRTYEREFYDLKIDPDGFVRIAFKLPNLAGTEIPFELALRVTSSAVRRGANIDFWSQRAFCGVCGRDTLKEDAQRFYETGELEPLPQIPAGACQRWKSSAIALKRPFQRELGHAYLASMPKLKEFADDVHRLHRSPFLLCENERVAEDPHSSHEAIRRSGHGSFSHWEEQVYFSSSDGSDPNTNGREYALVRRPANE